MRRKNLKDFISNTDTLFICVMSAIYVIVVLSWIGLAIYFDKWWIALFSILFLPSIKLSKRAKCDGCGKLSEAASSYSKAVKSAEKSGWVHREVNGKNLDFCPDCWSLYQEKPSWLQTNKDAESYIRNKPIIPKDVTPPWEDETSECYGCKNHSYDICIKCTKDDSQYGN